MASAQSFPKYFVSKYNHVSVELGTACWRARLSSVAVRRNKERFPADFMFQFSKEEYEDLRLQIARSKSSWGGRRHAPYVFTEQGIAMLSSVLNSPRAIQVNITIIRTFVKLRQLLASHAELAHRLDQLEWRESERDGRVQYVFETIQQLIESPEADRTPKRQIGYPTEQ